MESFFLNHPFDFLQQRQKPPMHYISDTRFCDTTVDVVESTKILLSKQAFCRSKEMLPAPHEQAFVRDLERILRRVRIHDNGHVLFC